MVNKDFKFGGLNIRNWVVLQHTTTDLYLALPKVSIRNSTYYEGMYAKVLLFQFGLDTRYETSYYADQYAPATGMFYRQTKDKWRLCLDRRIYQPEDKTDSLLPEIYQSCHAVCQRRLLHFTPTLLLYPPCCSDSPGHFTIEHHQRKYPQTRPASWPLH